MAKIDHAGLITESYEDAQRFFEEVFGMRKWREDGEKPARRCWYMEGIQLNETAEKKHRTDMVTFPSQWNPFQKRWRSLLDTQ